MIPAKLLSLVAGWGVPGELVKPAIYVAFAFLVFGGLGVAKCAHEDSVIENHENAQRAANAEQNAQATEENTENARADDQRIGQEREELEGLPNDEDRPLTDSERAFLNCIRLQQKARAAGVPSPAC